ncbi:hypothetical protein SLS58_008234 [Diplodia intermedia]|uniref:Heterokaryon incompatibility domain-containing protein n=1 Tax=Diplodia intermedia TaxID=856260 RepID=A0ABR3TIU6_9PEZI
MVKRWARTCDNRHFVRYKGFEGPCFSPNPTMPTRLIDVSKAPAKIRLVNTGQMPWLPYVALSYCWGASQPVTTTIETLDQHMVEIPLERLPQALLDAVETAIWLGTPYLWIDALCIVQDCADDKEREIANMQQVFQNSYLTIVASRSNTANDGFLKTDNFWSPLATVPVLCEDGDMGSMLLVERKKHLGAGTREPLHSRGWTLQEVVLSPRLLIYGQDRVVWKCFCGDRGRVYDSDTGREGASDWNAYCGSAGLTTIRLSPSGNIVQPMLSISAPNLDLLLFTESAYSERLPKLYRLWNLIVQEYSNRRLTNPQDKLPALSGIVSYFKKGLRDDYVAGMWNRTLLYQLSWKTVDPATAVRPSVWRAPSWSWMSIDGAISFENDRHNWFSPLVEIITYRLVPAMQCAPFSHLSNGFLKLRGRLVQDSLGIDGCTVTSPRMLEHYFTFQPL